MDARKDATASPETLEKVREACRQLITSRKGLEVLESGYADNIEFVARDPEDGTLHFVQLAVKFAADPSGFVEAKISAEGQRMLEKEAERYLAGYDGPECRVSFDRMDLNVIANGRAFAKYCENVLACAEGVGR